MVPRVSTAPAPSPATLLGGRDPDELPAKELVGALVARFGDRVALACSFQKEEAVLLDMLLEASSSARAFALDTEVLFPETYELWRAVEARYGVVIERFHGPSLAEQEASHGPALWARDPDACCGLRKMEPLRRALAGLDCWITGVRRDQSPTRAGAPKLGWDAAHGLFKANPLADWTDEDVWAYVDERGLPVNPLHERGYASIGCTHCTLPGDGRAGRWAGTGKTECGLHLG